MNKTFVYLLLIVLIPLIFIGETSALTLRVADIHEEDYPTVRSLKYLGRLLAERSGGKIVVEVFHSRQLGDEKDSIEQCRAGAIDMVRTNLAPIIDSVPEAGVPALPYIFRSDDHLHRVLDGPIGRRILDALGKTDLVGLCFYESGARSFYNSRKPLQTIEDFKGLRIRVQQTELFKAMIEALGAIPVPMPYGEVGDALRTGVIDGAENNWPSYYSSGHYRVASYYTVDDHSMTPEVVVFSAKVWAGLPEADKNLIREAARDSTAHMRELWHQRETKDRKLAEAEGVKVVDIIDKEPFIKAMQPVYERFVTSDGLREIVRSIQAIQ